MQILVILNCHRTFCPHNCAYVTYCISQCRRNNDFHHGCNTASCHSVLIVKNKNSKALNKSLFIKNKIHKQFKNKGVTNEKK